MNKPADRDDLLQKVMKLRKRDRERIMHVLIEDIFGPPPGLSEQHPGFDKELERRIDKALDHPESLMTIEEFETRMREAAAARKRKRRR